VKEAYVQKTAKSKTIKGRRLLRWEEMWSAPHSEYIDTAMNLTFMAVYHDRVS